MNENMAVVRRTENTLYWGSILFSVLSILGLIGADGVEDIWLISITTLVIAIMGIVGVWRSKSNLPTEARHDYIFNTSYMAISLGISDVLLLLSPRSVETGVVVPSVVAAFGWVIIGVYCIWREKVLSQVAKWI